MLTIICSIFERYCVNSNDSDTVNDAIQLFKEKLNQSLYINDNTNNSNDDNNDNNDNNDNTTNNNIPLFKLDDIRYHYYYYY